MSYVQSDYNSGTGVTSLSITLAGVVAGNGLIAAILTSTTGVTVTASDNVGNTWSSAGTTTTGIGGFLRYVSSSNSGGSVTLTVSFSSAVNAAILFHEYSGAITADVTQQGSGNSTTASSGTSASTSVGNELVFVMIGTAINTGSITTPSGYTNRNLSTTTGAKIGTYDMIAATAGTQSASATVPSGNWIVILQTFSPPGTTITKTQSAVAKIVNVFNKTQGGTAKITPSSQYSYGSYSSLPTGSTSLTNGYTSTDMTNVATNDNTYMTTNVSSTYIIHEYKTLITGSPTAYLPTWAGKPFKTGTIYMDMYNNSTTTWDNIGSTSATAGVKVTFNGSVTSSLANYKDSNNYIAVRVRQ